jgi:hypothetical protein
VRKQHRANGHPGGRRGEQEPQAEDQRTVGSGRGPTAEALDQLGRERSAESLTLHSDDASDGAHDRPRDQNSEHSRGSAEACDHGHHDADHGHDHHSNPVSGSKLWAHVLALAQEFAKLPRSDDTVYGFAVGLYPTDHPTLPDTGDEALRER